MRGLSDDLGCKGFHRALYVGFFHDLILPQPGVIVRDPVDARFGKEYDEPRLTCYFGESLWQVFSFLFLDIARV